MKIVVRRIVVLIKDGKLQALECDAQDIPLAARLRSAGICGTFDDFDGATAFIAKLREQQRSIPGWTSLSAEEDGS